MKLKDTSPNPLRIYSIDVFRAITILLMIFVNDLWTGPVRRRSASFENS